MSEEVPIELYRKENGEFVKFVRYDDYKKLENIIKELNDKIEDDKMIIEGNWGCIDNLRKDYNLQKNIIKEVREYIEEHTNYDNCESKNHLDLTDRDNLLEILDKGE